MSAGERLAGAPEPMHVWTGAQGLRIAGDSWGPPRGPLVILQHGGGQTRHAWKGAGERLAAAGYRAVAFDARGHGDSEWAADGRYGQDAMVEDLVCVVSALGDPRPALVGASMGGGTSLVAVGEDRVDATALVLVDVAPRIDEEGARRILEFMAQNPDGFESLEDVARAIADYQPQRKRPRTLDGLAKNVRRGRNGRYYWHWDPRFRRSARHGLTTRQARLEACARALRLPTLLVRGGLSDVLTEEGAQAFLALCAQCEYVNVPNAAHMVAGDRNDVFTGAVLAFLSRTVPVGGPPAHPPHVLNPHHEGPASEVQDIPVTPEARRNDGELESKVFQKAVDVLGPEPAAAIEQQMPVGTGDGHRHDELRRIARPLVRLDATRAASSSPSTNRFARTARGFARACCCRISTSAFPWCPSHNCARGGARRYRRCRRKN
jgi:non-heme chloroperoxidase